MKYILLAQNEEMARNDAEPFIPDSLLMFGLRGIVAFGRYDTQKEASEALQKFPTNEDWNLAVVPLRELSEDVDNPHAALWTGDSPDE